MNLQLKNIKVHHGLSQETLCFEASVYLEGKRIGTIANRGCGGANEIGISATDVKRIESWLAKNQTYKGYDGETKPMNFELWSFLEAERHTQEKDLKSKLKSKVLVMDDTCELGEAWTWTFRNYDQSERGTIKGVTEHVEYSKDYKNPVVLNTMCFEDAYNKFYGEQS